ncbi:hypothetical protein VT03_11170 [Planctomyces sp. SH-PL14]|nr:hypothetical protein VT03_11170 [Planctomyces sp. SH-PL14]
MLHSRGFSVLDSSASRRWVQLLTLSFVGIVLTGSLWAQSPPTSKPSFSKGPLEQAIDAAFQRAKSADQAVESLAILEALLQDKGLSSTQRKKIELELGAWKERAGNKLVRNGNDWVTVEVNAERIKEANFLVEKALVDLAAKDYRSCKEGLEKASRVNENGIQADFLLGMLNTPAYANSPETGERHFRKVLNRCEDHIPSLNNLALCCIRQKKLAPAIDAWRRLAELAPETPELAYNVVHLMAESANSVIPLTTTERRRFEALLVGVPPGSIPSAESTKDGWRYMYLAVPRSDVPSGSSEPSSGLMLETGLGNGFVIAPGLVVTSRELLGNAVTVKISSPTTSGELDAELVGASGFRDVALLRCTALKAPPVWMASAAPSKGANVVAMGRSRASVDAADAEVLKCKIAMLPTTEAEGLMLLDAPSAFFGGPILDEGGHVVGMRSSGFKLPADRIGAVPTSDLLAFAKMVDASFAPSTAPIPRVDEERLAVFSKAIVTIRCYQPVVPMDSPNGDSVTARWLADPVCNLCNGPKFLNCHARGCQRGKIARTRNVVAGKDPVLGKDIIKPVTEYFPCGTCNGSGKIPCPRCR